MGQGARHATGTGRPFRSAQDARQGWEPHPRRGGPNLWTSEVISQGLRWVVCENNARQGTGAPARATGS